jgi:Flp pilus assembly pilin Flp
MRGLLRAEDGPTATEYAVLIAIICIGVIAAMGTFGVHVDSIYASLAGTMPGGS